MLFNSFEFVFAFLPLTALGYWIARRYISLQVTIAWLVITSLFFYGWWNPIYVPMLLGSALLNFFLGSVLADAKRFRKPLLILGLTWNLGLLGYFKYCDFFLSIVNSVAGIQLPMQHIVLPLALSFFTFQKVAYLIDVYRGEVTVKRLDHFLLFVTFFPQLLAGPIVHYRDIVPQFINAPNKGPRADDIALGLTIFTVGLFKKVVLADGMLPQANELFRLAATGHELDFFMAWNAALSYTTQLYFDFSGYSDMAIGLARMLSFRMPINFNSPLKSSSIKDTWGRRWHITLSNFLRDYVYTRLGGSRVPLHQTCFAIIFTFTLSGLWHGAGWSYVLWGMFNGVLVAAHMLWSKLRVRLGWQAYRKWWDDYMAVVITFICLSMGLVIFRADSYHTSTAILSGMIGLHGFSLPAHWLGALGGLGAMLGQLGVQASDAARLLQVTDIARIAVLMAIAFLLPNVYSVAARFEPAIMGRNHIDPTRITWKANALWALFIGGLAIAALINMSRVSEFIYFQF